MIISDTHRFIFVHVPKSAGRSCHSAITLGLPEHERANHWALDLVPRKNRHATVCEVEKVFAQTGRAKLADYTIFAFVRNPWDRLLATYFFYRKHVERRPVEDMRRWMSKLTSFELFVHEVCDGQGMSTSLEVCHPQFHYLVDDNDDCRADFIVGSRP